MLGKAIVASLLVASSLVPFGAASAQSTEPDWQSLPYFRHDYGGWMRIWTNENTFTKGSRKINFTTAFNPYPGPTIEEQSSESQVLWGKCNATKQQTFRTSRDVYLPGTPNKLQTTLGAYASHLYDKPSPITSVELLVNGTSVHKVTASKDKPIPFEPAQRAIATITDAPIRYGLNTFTIVGHKKETKKKAGWCALSDNWYGVFGEVYGEFLADMEIKTDKEAAMGVRDAMLFKTKLTNRGPSDLIPGSSFGVIVVSGTERVTELNVFGVPGCGQATPYSTGYKSGFRIYCAPFERLPAKQALEPSVRVVWDNPPVGARSEITVTTIGYGENDAAETGNNFETLNVVVEEGGEARAY